MKYICTLYAVAEANLMFNVVFCVLGSVIHLKQVP